MTPTTPPTESVSPDEFDDELEDIEEFLPDDARPFIEEVAEQIVPSDAINIDNEIGAAIPRAAFVSRVNSHFAESGFGYKPVSGDTFKLRVKSSRYPLFGAFSGRIHIIEEFGHHPTAHPTVRFYQLTGVLRFRLSVLYVTTVSLVFLMLLWWLSPGFLQTVVFFFFGVGASVAAGYTLGRGQRDEVIDRIEESFLRLRTTIMNRR